MSVSAAQLRAARALLQIRGEDFAERAGIGVATLRRFERGAVIGQLHLNAIAHALEALGIVLIPEGAEIDGIKVGQGVATKYRTKEGAP